MMKKQLLSLLICLCMLLSLAPQTASAASSYTAVYSGQTFGALTLSTGSYLLENCTINGGDNTAGVTLTAGSIVDLYIKGKVTVSGGNSTAGTYGGAPGIYVPEGTALRLWDISGTTADLRVYGGKGADAKPGTVGLYMPLTKFRDAMEAVAGETYDGGVGGWGASGGGAAIGTFGGTGGRGGGRSGKVLRSSGGNGTTAAAMGYVFIIYQNSSSKLTVKGGSGGAAAKGGYGGVGITTNSGVMKYVVASGSGGGGGGGNGSQGADVGTGGGGGGGGGMGGMALTNKGFWASMSGAGGGGAGQGVTQNGGGGGGGNMKIATSAGGDSSSTYEGDLQLNTPTNPGYDYPPELIAVGGSTTNMIQLAPGEPGKNGNAKSSTDIGYRITLSGAKPHTANSGEGGKADGTGGQAGYSSDGDDFRSKAGGNGGAAGAGATSYNIITYDFCDEKSLFTSYNTTSNTVGTNMPAAPTRTGYAFDGWYTGKNGTGSKVTSATSISSLVTTFYANWLAAPSNFSADSMIFMQGQSYGVDNPSHMTAEGAAPMTWTLAEGALPDGMTLTSSADGTAAYLVGTPTKSGSFSAKFTITNKAGSLTTPLVSFTVSNPPEYAPAYIDTTGTLLQRVGMQSSAVLRAKSSQSTQDPTTPIIWTVKAGELPDGITLTTEDDGLSASLTGTPAVAGTYPVTLRIRNKVGMCEQGIIITVLEANEPAKILTEALPDAVKGKPYNTELLYTGTNEDRAGGKLELTISPLPDGMTSSDAVLQADGTSVSSISSSSVTAEAGEYNITWTAYHAQSDNTYSDSDIKEYTLRVLAAEETPTFITSRLGEGHGDVFYTQQLNASGGGNMTYELTEGRLPAGMTLTESGLLSGTPTEDGDFTFTVTAANGVGSTNQELFLHVAPGNEWVSITTQTLTDGSEDEYYCVQLSAAGRELSWSAVGLPDGLTLSTAGLLSGTPTEGGDFYFTVTATNSINNYSDSQNLVLHIVPTPIPPTITTESLANGTVGLIYNEMLTATGDPSIRWLVIDGALPAGLKLDTASGVISGTAAVEGTYTFTIAADNSVIPYALKEFSITVVPTPVTPTITTTGLPSGKVNEPYYYKLTATGDEPITWSATTQNALPPGMTLSADGVLSGTPEHSGAVIVALVATNASGADTQLLALNIAQEGEDLTQLYFTTQPAAFIPLITGKTATLTAEAYVSRSDDTIKYAWFKCDEDGNPDGGEIYSGSSYALPADLTKGVHYYLCEARVQETSPKRNEIVAVSNVAVVMVGPAATEQLPTPTGLAWYGAASVIGKATWNVVVRAEGYSVQLYKDSTALGAPVTVPNVTTCDFTDAITAAGSGNYFFTVKAIGDILTYADSDISAESATRVYTAPVPLLPTPSGLAWDADVPAKATWTAVTNASSYSVQLYRDGAADGSARAIENGTECDFTDDITETGKYTFTVTALASGAEYASSSESAKSAEYSYVKPAGSIILDSAKDLSGAGWDWDHDSRTLTLDDATLGDVYMTGNEPVTINVLSDSAITGTLGHEANDFYTKYAVTGTEGASLDVKNISGGNNYDSVSVKDGVSLSVQTGYWGGSGGADSFLTVAGDGSSFTLDGSAYLNNYSVKAGAVLDITGAMTITAGGSLEIDHASRINLSDGLTIESASPADYEWLLPYLPSGYFFEQNGGSIVLMESESARATQVSIYYRTPSVTSVAVTPALVSVNKGSTQLFSAAVIGTDDPAQTVIWTVEGGISGTSVDANGKLTVAAGETAATLTVRATSALDAQKSGTATVTVTEPQTYGIALDIPDTTPLIGVDFSALVFGYMESDLTAKTVTVRNTGNQPTGALIVTLSTTAFSASKAAIESIPAGGTASFEIKPAVGLGISSAAMNYTAALAVTPDSGNANPLAGASCELRVSVNPLSILTVDSANPSAVQDKKYDGATAANVIMGRITGIAEGDDVTVTAAGEFDTKNVGENKSVTVTYALSGMAAKKYIAPQSETLYADITEAQLTVSGTTADSKAYDAGTAATIHIGTVSGIVSGDDVAVTGTGTFSDESIGMNKTVTVVYSLLGADAGNYFAPENDTLTAGISGTVAAPVALPAEGVYSEPLNVTLSCATEGATIRYTTNGDEPAESSAEYTAAIPVSVTTTIKARAFKEGMTESEAVSFTYTLVPIPTYSVTLTITKDNSAYSGLSISIKDSDGADYPMTEETGGAYINAAVPNGSYAIYKGGVSVGRQLAVNGADENAALEYFTVSFSADGGTPAPAAQIVLKGEPASAPAAMTKGTDTFDGWYSDAGLTAQWDFASSKVTAAITLFAKWTSNDTVPTILTQPKDQYVVVGQCATFTIAADGNNLSYQWYINRNDSLGWQKLDGKTGTSCTTAAVTLANDGYRYRCDVSGTAKSTIQSNGTLQSGIAVLHVSAPVVPPETGDGSALMLWICMAALSALGLLLTIRKKRHV